MVKSRYVVVVENVSSITPRKDVEKECERVAGPVLAAAKDNDRRMALVEFKYSSDAEYAWRKLHNTTMDGRSWKLDWATPSDFKLMGWKWTEGGLEGGSSYGHYSSNYRGSGKGATGDRSRSRSPPSSSRPSKARPSSSDSD